MLSGKDAHTTLEGPGNYYSMQTNIAYNTVWKDNKFSTSPALLNNSEFRVLSLSHWQRYPGISAVPLADRGQISPGTGRIALEDGGESS
jgi:hypothetical protein